MANIRRHLAEADTSGGRVIMIDVHSYTSQHLAWLSTNTGLNMEFFDRLITVPRFSCQGVQFVSVEDLR